MSQSNGFVAFLRVIGRGLNITRIVILNVIFFGILFLFFVGAASHDEGPRVASDSVLVLQPRGKLVEQYSVAPLQRALAKLNDQGVRQVRVRDLLRGIDAAATDDRIHSLLLLPDELQAGGYAALREVGKALDRFRSAGKKVYVWSAGMSQAQYYLAAHADRIMLDPQGSVLLTGISNYRLYLKDLLSKLGIRVRLFRVGKYKSAAEPYILDHASDAAKQAAAYWMGGLWDTYLADVASERGLDEDHLRGAIRALPARVVSAQGSLAQLALDENLVDTIMTRPQMRAWLREQARPKGADGFRHVGLRRYLAGLPAAHAGAGRKVAVVVAEGDVTAGSQPGGTIGGESTARLIHRVRTDDSYAALVLRVDSPGGAVHPAERIRRQVELTRKAGKPVVVSMGDMAASGGYWIGMNANRIFAEPNTITGSIGIFGIYPHIAEALDKIGVHTDGVGTTPWAGAMDIRRPLDPRMAKLLQSVIDKGYRDFVGHVAAARGVSFDAIDKVAQGRVWTGKQAHKRGLVDQLGGLGDAVQAAAKLADLGDNYGFAYVEPSVGPLQQFLARLGNSKGAAMLSSLGLHVPSAWLDLARRAPVMRLLGSLTPGEMHSMAYCFCRVDSFSRPSP